MPKKPVATEMLNLRLFILSPFQIAIKYISTVGPKKARPQAITPICCRYLLYSVRICVCVCVG